MEGTVENSESKRKRNDEEVDDACYGTARTMAKKPRIRWTTDLHGKFLQAIALIIERKNPYKRFGNSNEFGESQVVPKEILEEMRKMGVKGLDRHHVSSHLQKHRLTSTKNTGGESLDQNNNADPSYSAQFYYMPIMESDFSAPAPDHYHLFPRNLAVDYPTQQHNYYPLPMAQLHQPSIWNPGRCNVDAGTAPMNLHQFSRPPSDCFGSQNQPMTFSGPHSVNQLGFSAPTYHPWFINTAPYSTASPPSLSSIDYQSPEAASNIINPEVNFLLQHACLGPDTTTAATNDHSNTGNSEAPTTLCDQDTGLPGLDGIDLLWLEKLIGEGNDLN